MSNKKVSERLVEGLSNLGDKRGFIGWPDELEDVIHAVEDLENALEQARTLLKVYAGPSRQLPRKVTP